MVLSDIRIWFFACVFCAMPIRRNLISADRDNIYKLMFSKNSADRWSVNVLKNKVSVSELDEVEPGFDLTEEEIKKFKLWPGGIIPYYIDDFSYDKVLRDRVRSFLDVVGGVTGLHFRELPNPPEDSKTRWIFFVNRRGLLGCSDHSSTNMTNEGVQRVVLGYNCMSEEGELAETVLAIVGVPPQHNSPDRDNYIIVQPEHILPDKQHLFQKLQNSDWLFHDLEYDFFSAGHFNFHKHTKDGLATINPKKPIDLPVGENDGLSYTDILKIRMLYNYIARKKSKAIKGPECDKLFEPGTNFSQFEPDHEDEIQPRSKPNRYLGLADDNDQKEVLNAEKVNDEEEKDNSKSNEKEKNNSEEDKTVEQKKTDDDKSPEIAVLKGADPFQLLSDYDTEENNRIKQRGRKKKKSRRY